jgi:hypothetical protein
MAEFSGEKTHAKHSAPLIPMLKRPEYMENGEALVNSQV